uniref:DEP domain-containing protein n=1 Tax=Steinernema glaseri TaxID=37863 RepID=A0A1I7YUV8_9BILA
MTRKDPKFDRLVRRGSPRDEACQRDVCLVLRVMGFHYDHPGSPNMGRNPEAVVHSSRTRRSRLCHLSSSTDSLSLL